MVFVSNFQIIRPEFEIDQEASLNWLIEAHEKAEKKVSGETLPAHIKSRLFKIGLGEDKIQKRGVSFGDVFHLDWEKMEIYNLNHSPKGFHLKERTQLFDQLVTRLFEDFYPQETHPPHHLIHVTCTGYSAPSGAQKLVSSRKLPTTVTHAYHMGCYAAMPALRMAKGYVSTHNPVDIVHTEVCSLHMNPLTHNIEQLVIQTLFADGYIKYSLSYEEKGFALLALHEEVIPNSLEFMEWTCHEWGLAMKLSKEVPRIIAQALLPFLERLVNQANLSLSDILETGYFAIHPGGVKIIQEISKLLNLKPWQTAHSRFIMQNYGNMSSATQPHIWAEMAKDKEVPSQSIIVSFAFGPGLTISGGVFQKCGG